MPGDHCLSWEIANGNKITAGCSDIMCTFKLRENNNKFFFFFLVHRFLKYNQGDAGKHLTLGWLSQTFRHWNSDLLTF